MPKRVGNRGSSQVNVRTSITDVLGRKYLDVEYKSHHADEPKLIVMHGALNLAGYNGGAPSDVATYWPAGEVNNFFEDAYPNWITISKRAKIDLDDSATALSAVGSGEEKSYFERLLNAAGNILPLQSLLLSRENSRICNQLAADAVSRRYRPIEFALNRLAEYECLQLFRDIASTWHQLVADRPNGPLFVFEIVSASDADSSTDQYDWTDINVIDDRINRMHTLLDTIDADDGNRLVRTALGSLGQLIGASTGPWNVGSAVVDPSRVGVYKQMALRKDDPDVGERTHQYPNNEVESGRVDVYVTPGVEPHPYLLTPFRPGIIYVNDNFGDSASLYGMYNCGISSAISDQEESFLSYYKRDGSHNVEQLNYNEDADDPVALTKIWPHFIHGKALLQDSSSNPDRITPAMSGLNKIDVPLQNFYENGLHMLEQASKKLASFRSTT